jgi:hypothetical protein
MSKITKTITTAAVSIGVVAGLGVAAMPLTSYAAVADTDNVTVQVTVGDVCSISTDFSQATVGLSVDSVTNPTDEDTSAAVISCNTQSWEFTEQIASTFTQSLAGTSPNTATIGKWTAGTTVSSFDVNTWSAKYACTDCELTAYHAVPANGSPATIIDSYSANSSVPSVADDLTVTATYGVKIDSTIPVDTYSTQILYTLND